MLLENYDRIVFAGDSVTDMESTQPVGEGLFDSLGKSYVRIIENLLVACYPERNIRITNSGISGNTSRDLLNRFDRDVVDLNPDWVSICIGPRGTGTARRIRREHGNHDRQGKK